MRVLVVTPWFPCARLPGSGLFNLRDIDLISQQHDVTVLHLISPSHVSPEEPAEGTVLDGRVKVYRQPFDTADPKLLLRAKSAIQNHMKHAELVHTMAMPALLPTRLAKPKKPWVHTEHYSQLVTPPSSARAAVSLKLLSRLFAAPTETIAVSRALADVIDESRKRPATVIGNEVMEPVAELPGERDLTESVHLIGVGGIIGRKGPIEAVETMAELVNRGVNASLVWVGEGDLREPMLQRAEALGVGTRVRLTGQLPPEALSRELLASDVFLLPVETETFGVAIAEAMTHGLPVVVTGTGGHEEFLIPEASRLISERSAGPLADAVQSLLGDPELWNRQQIASFAEQKFSNAQRSRQYAEVYVKAVAGFSKA